MNTLIDENTQTNYHNFSNPNNLFQSNGEHKIPYSIFQNSTDNSNQTPTNQTLTNKISNLSNERNEIEKRSGNLWTCTRCLPQDKGNLYEFKLKTEFDDITHPENLEARKRTIEKNKELFPSVEDSASSLYVLDSSLNYEEVVEKIIEQIINDNFKEHLENDLRNIQPDQSYINHYKDRQRKSIKKEYGNIYIDHFLVRSLGYEMQCRNDGVFLYLPDKQMLLDRWKNLKIKRPELPDLKIASCIDDIAEDAEFKESFLKNDILLSEGKQFIHDSISHLIPTLSQILSNPKTYTKNKKRIVESINNISQKILNAKKILTENNIEKFEKLNIFLGILTDTLSANSFDSTANIEMQFDCILLYAYKDIEWKVYLEKRFEGSCFTPKDICNFWSIIKEINR